MSKVTKQDVDRVMNDMFEGEPREFWHTHNEDTLRKLIEKMLDLGVSDDNTSYIIGSAFYAGCDEYGG